MRKVIIFGATSSIAQEVAKLFSARHDELFLVARSEEKLRAVREDLRIRGATKVDSYIADLDRFDLHKAIIDRAVDSLSGLDTVLLAHGALGDQKACEQDFSLTGQVLRTNFLSTVSILTLIANRFEEQKGGCIAVISSVAGDRGRGSNYPWKSGTID